MPLWKICHRMQNSNNVWPQVKIFNFIAPKCKMTVPVKFLLGQYLSPCLFLLDELPVSLKTQQLLKKNKILGISTRRCVHVLAETAAQQ